MCFSSGPRQPAAQSGVTQKAAGFTPEGTGAAAGNTVQPEAATSSPTRRRRFNNYDGFNTDLVGAGMGAASRTNDNSPNGALKKLMGA